MKIEWLGHASFLLELESGLKIVTDPYEPQSYSGAVGYSEINIDADIVTVSHAHFDHAYTKPFSKAKIITTAGFHKIDSIEIEGFLFFHDKAKGSQRGENIIFIIRAEGLKIGHFGDLGHIPQNIERLEGLDVVLIPTGGTFTLDGKEASVLIEKIKPLLVIPMHYKTSKVSFPIEGPETFIKGKENVEVLDVSRIEIEKEMLKPPTKIVVLKPSH